MPIVLLRFVEGLLGDRYAKYAKPLIFIVIGLLVFGLVVAVRSCDKKQIVDQHEQKLQQRAAPATNTATIERVEDETILMTKSEELHNAVNSQPEQAIAPSTKSLGCQRLRNAGKHSAACK